MKLELAPPCSLSPASKQINDNYFISMNVYSCKYEDTLHKYIWVSSVNEVLFGEEKLHIVQRGKVTHDTHHNHKFFFLGYKYENESDTSRSKNE